MPAHGIRTPWAPRGGSETFVAGLGRLNRITGRPDHRVLRAAGCTLEPAFDVHPDADVVFARTCSIEDLDRALVALGASCQTKTATLTGSPFFVEFPS